MLTQANILTGGLLYNNYHSPYDGISSLTPQAEHGEAQHDRVAALRAGPAELWRRRAAGFGRRVS